MKHKSELFMSICAALIGLCVLLFALSTVSAQIDEPKSIRTAIVVDTLDDELNSDGDCALREAITAANDNIIRDACSAGDGVITDTITFDVAGTITVTGQLSVTAGGPMVIDGGDVITVSGGGTTRILWVESGSELVLQGLVLGNGYTTDIGAGISNNAGRVAIVDSVLFGNNGAGWGGGGIYNSGTLYIINSIISNNNSFYGGGIANEGFLTLIDSTMLGNIGTFGGGISNYSSGVVNLINSTLTGNSASYDGGGIDNNYSMVTITNSTLSGNNAGNVGGGINNYQGTLTTTNTTISENNGGSGGGISKIYGYTIVNSSIVANNTGGDCHYLEAITDGGHNISSDDTCAFDPANGSMPNTDPLLGPLQDNGGPTWTHALFGNSPAIDAGDNVQCPPTDQRGILRPLDGDHDGQFICDIGSFEFSQRIDLYPAHQSGFAASGATVEYTLALYNFTSLTDTYALSAGAHAWDTVLSTATVGLLSPGISQTFTVSVTIPADAQPGDSDAVTIQATSMTSPTVYTSTAMIHTTTANGDLAYVPMGNEDSLALIDTAVHTTTDTLDLAQYGCDFPQRAKLNLDGSELYVTCDYSANIIVLDTTDLSLVAVIDRPGTCHQDVAFVRDGHYALASTGGGCEQVTDIAVIDTASHTIVQYISTPGYMISSIAAHPFLPLAYATSYQCCYSGSVMVIDTNTFTVQTMIPFGTITWGVQPSRDGQWVYASDYYGQQGLAKINPQTNEVVDTISGMGELFGLQVSRDGSRLFVAGGWSGNIYVLDAIEMTYITSIPVGGLILEMALTCDGSEMYVAREGSTIPVVNTQTYSIIDNIYIPGTSTGFGIAICPLHAEGVFLVPPVQAKYGGRGENVIYQETLFNNSGITETFMLEALGNTWDTQLSTSQIGPLSSGETASFTVTVTVPDDVPWYATDHASIFAVGANDPELTAEAQVTTQAYAPPQIHIDPLSLESTQWIDNIVTQSLTISNGAGVTLTFAISETVACMLLFILFQAAFPRIARQTSRWAFDATAMPPGVYETTLYVNINDRSNPVVGAEVTMTVASIAPLSVVIDGLQDGLVGEFLIPSIAAVSPISTTLPVEYSWQASGKNRSYTPAG